jgi:hypothetical protein
VASGMDRGSPSLFIYLASLTHFARVHILLRPRDLEARRQTPTPKTPLRLRAALPARGAPPSRGPILQQRRVRKNNPPSIRSFLGLDPTAYCPFLFYFYFSPSFSPPVCCGKEIPSESPRRLLLVGLYWSWANDAISRDFPRKHVSWQTRDLLNRQST